MFGGVEFKAGRTKDSVLAGLETSLFSMGPGLRLLEKYSPKPLIPWMHV